MEEQYFLQIVSKDGEVAVYNDKTKLVSSFNADFDAISKPKTSIYSAKNLRDSIEEALFVLNRYYFLESALIVDVYEDVAFEIKREELKEFLKFYRPVK